MDDTQYTQCTACNKAKANNEFSKNQLNKDNPECKICVDERVAKQATSKKKKKQPTHLYADPLRAVWIPCIIIHTTTDQPIITYIRLIGDSESEQLLEIRSHQTNQLIKFDPESVYKPYKLQLNAAMTEQSSETGNNSVQTKNKTALGKQNEDDVDSKSDSQQQPNATRREIANSKKKVTIKLPEPTPNTSTQAKPTSDTQIKQNAKIYMDIVNQYKGVPMPKEHKDRLITLQYTHYLQQMSSTSSNIKTPSDSQTYTQYIWEDQNIRPFKCKFPADQAEFWIYITAMNRYKNENIKITEDRLLRRILDSVKPRIRDDWNTYKEDRCREIDNDDIDLAIGDRAARIKEVKAGMQTFAAFESFLMDKLHINPSRAYFEGQLHHVRVCYNENPVDADKRFITYLNQSHVAMDRFNANRTGHRRLEPFNEKEQLRFYHRAFVWDNDRAEFKNNGPLNHKVRKVLSHWWDTAKNITLAQFRQKLRQIHTQILPIDMIRNDVDGEHWHKFRSEITIFQMKPVHQLSGTKRDKLRREPDGPATKKPRTPRKPRCKFGAKCRDLLQTGKCNNYYHPQPEIKAARKLRQQRNNSKDDRSNNRWNRSSYSDDKKPSPRRHDEAKKTGRRCKFGSRCTKYQDGSCNYDHNKWEMTCSFCHKSGHPKFDCWKFKSIQKSQQHQQAQQTPQTPSHYNPFQHPNPNPTFPHSLPMKIGNQYYQQQLVPINNPPITTSSIPDSVPNPSIPNNYTSLTMQKQEKQMELKAAKSHCNQLKRELGSIAQQQQQQKLAITPNQFHQFLTPRHQQS